MHVGPQTVRSCAKLQVVPSVLSRRLSDQEGCGAEPQSARSEGRVSGNGSTDPGIALQSMVSSLAKFVDNNNLGQKSSSAASDLARTPNPNSCTIEADTSGQEAAPLQSASTSQDRTKKEAFAQLESSRHNSETDCQEGSQQGDVEETAEDLLAAEQLCALATVGREATAAAESSPKPSEDRQIAAAGGDQPLPTWQVKRPRTNSFRGRQDFDSLESALRESGMSVVNGQQDFLNAFLNAQNSTRRAAVSLGAPGNGFKNCTTPTKRRRLDVGALLDSTMDQPMAESQPVEGDSCNDGLKLESESMGLAEDDGHCGRRGSNDSSATAVPDAEMSVDGAGSPTCHGLEAMKDATEAKGVAVDAQDYSTQMSSLRLGVLST
ncbi:unnamed protein product [Ostreobium quekettii]|uniref:Uncharacterized protein n=1 Tax=Ostreobium quekettii TaxID=121088 RepID=A0A8S1J9J1_9CHLO|nr:unnamed protein product [Ostreobium quekettii]